MFLLSFAATAQNKLNNALDKGKTNIDSTASKTKGFMNSVTSAASMFGAGKSKQTVTIRVPRAKRSQLKVIVEGLKGFKGVDKDGTEIAECDDNDQKITVVYSKGNIGDMLDTILKNNSAMFKPDFTQAADKTITIDLL